MITVPICVCCVSFKRFIRRMHEIRVTIKPSEDDIQAIKSLTGELDRISILQTNFIEIEDKVNSLEVPIPDEASIFDSSQSSLNKISTYLEKHSLMLAGTEQLLLSLMPASQVNQSIKALLDTLPPDLLDSIFGDALSSIKDSISTLPQEGLTRFVKGMGNLSPIQIKSMVNALENHQLASAVITPIKSGALELFGVNDAAKHLVSSMGDIGENVATSLEVSSSVTDLTDLSNLDMSGHIPVITLVSSSIREVQLLSNNHTTCLNSIKNIALDATGTGIGSITGMKIGATVGWIFGPVGSIAGGFLGSVGGAVVGRWCTNKIKIKPLNRAIEAYKNGYDEMTNSTTTLSRKTLESVKSHAEEQSRIFKGEAILTEYPIMSTTPVLTNIAEVLYKYVYDYAILEMTALATHVQQFVWYRAEEYGRYIKEYQRKINDIKKHLPSRQALQEDPRTAIQMLLHIQLPNRKLHSDYMNKIRECLKLLKEFNDKNDSNVMVWAYMVNNLYQNSLNEIANFANNKMIALNKEFTNWKSKMNGLEEQITFEKRKLGY